MRSPGIAPRGLVAKRHRMRLSPQQSSTTRDRDRFRAAQNIEFPKYGLDVTLDGYFADKQFRPDEFIGLPLGQQI